MAWFLRKAFRLGPLRINLSKSGLGASFGVKGLRAGVDAKGRKYVAGGRGGLYFREYARRPSGQADLPAPLDAPEPDLAPERAPTSPLVWILLGAALALAVVAIAAVVLR